MHDVGDEGGQSSYIYRMPRNFFFFSFILFIFSEISDGLYLNANALSCVWMRREEKIVYIGWHYMYVYVYIYTVYVYVYSKKKERESGERGGWEWRKKKWR